MGRISVLCPSLSSNALYTPWMFSGALARRHRVSLIGPNTAQLWLPAEGEVAVDATLPGSSPARSAVRTAAISAARGSELLYAFKAHPASFGLGLWLRRKLGLPLAIHLDDWDAGYFTQLGPIRRARHAARRWRSVDNELRLRLLERRIPTADIVTVSTRALQRRFGGRVIRQGVDSERLSPDLYPRRAARRRLGLAEDVPLVLFLGTPVMHKGLAELIEAVEALPGAWGARLWVVGDAPHDPEAMALLSGSKRVEQRSCVPFGEAHWYIAASDVFVVPQRSSVYAAHQVPAKLLHAMALGACIVGTDVGDIAELLGGSPLAGVVVPPADPGALSVAIGELLHDPARREALAAEARRRAEEQYSWRAMGQALDEEIEKLGFSASPVAA